MSYAEDALANIDACAERVALPDHPFFRAWAAGELDRDSLRQFATQNFPNVDAFSRHVSRIHSRAEDLGTRRALLELLNSIEGEDTASQSELWLRFCASLGLFSDSVRSAARTVQTQACLDRITELCRQSTVAGLAAVYAYYRLSPVLTRLQLDGLTQHYGMADGPGRQYFENRAYAAPQLSQRLREALESQIVGKTTAAEAAAATESALDALYDLVTGVMESAPEPITEA